MTKTKPDHDPDHDHDHDNDNDNGGAVAPAPTGGALASLLTALGGGAQRRRHARPSAAVRALPMLQFKRDGDGTWMFGQRRTIPEAGSRGRSTRRRSSGATSASATATRCSASASFRSASRCPTSRSCPTRASRGSSRWAVNLKCLDGADAGVEVIYKTDDRRRHPGRRRTDRGGARPAQRRPARRQSLADRAARKGLLPALAVREDLDRRC